MTAFRVLFYVQHLLGIGHLVRAGRVAESMASHGLQVTLVCGGVPVPGFAPGGVDIRQMPAMAVGGDGFAALVDEHGQVIDEQFRTERCQQLLRILAEVQPDAVIIEAFPFGRRQMRFELLPLIEAIESRQPKPLLLSSVRDILQRRRKPGRDEESAALLKAHFDHVLVHGDPQLASLEQSFPLAREFADRIHHTGLVCGPVPEASACVFDVVVSAGGGAVGDRLVTTAIQAARLLPRTLSWCVIGGPNLPADRQAVLAVDCPENVQLERFRPDFPQLLASAGLSVSQAGYNTSGDILQAGCRAILIPFREGGENEQSDRAARLEALGLATVLDEDTLDADTLAAAIRRSLDSQASPTTSLDTLGAQGTARLVCNLIQQTRTG